MLLTLIGGALVTKTGSGMGCGRSWPLCSGEWSIELIIELSHRIVSGSVGILVLILCICSWIKLGHIRETKFLCVISFSFIVIQGLIGAAAVLWGQSDFILALHFGISLISFSTVLLLTLLIFEVDEKFNTEKISIDRRMTFHIVSISLFSYIVVYSGALVRHAHASLVCKDWPLCDNSSFSLPIHFLEWVQMGHRGAAGSLYLWIGYATFLAIKHYKYQKVIYIGWIIAFILASLQVIAGALMIYSQLNLYIALFHAFFISCLFGLLSYFILLVSRNKSVSALIIDVQTGGTSTEIKDTR